MTEPKVGLKDKPQAPMSAGEELLLKQLRGYGIGAPITAANLIEQQAAYIADARMLFITQMQDETWYQRVRDWLVRTESYKP